MHSSRFYVLLLSLGIWYGILQGITFVAVLSNVSILLVLLTLLNYPFHE